jgi:hypothetical protein
MPDGMKRPLPTAPATPAGAYRSQVLQAPRLGRTGVEHGSAGRRRTLTWGEVATALAAEVGEPQGVRTIVFDLLVDGPDGRVALRFDAEPGDDATAIARILTGALGERARPSLKGLAADGVPTRWFPDLASFEEAAAEEAAEG